MKINLEKPFRTVTEACRMTCSSSRVSRVLAELAVMLIMTHRRPAPFQSRSWPTRKVHLRWNVKQKSYSRTEAQIQARGEGHMRRSQGVVPPPSGQSWNTDDVGTVRCKQRSISHINPWCAHAGWRRLMISSKVKRTPQHVLFRFYFLNGVRRPMLCQKFLRLGSASMMTCWGNAGDFWRNSRS